MSVECGYIGFYRWNHRRTRPVGIPVGNSDGEWTTSLYGDPGLNSLVIPSVQLYEKIPLHQNVFFFLIIPSVILLIFADFLAVNS